MRGATMSKLDIKQLIEKKNHRKKELLKLMSEDNILFSLIPRPQSYPDFAGRFLNNVGEALFTAMCENDSEMVETLFKRYFFGCLLEYEKLRPEDFEKAWQSLNSLKIAAASLLDMMDISGYAFLLSEYHDEPILKKPIEQAWDVYLNDESGIQRFQSFAAVVSLSESDFEIAHRSSLRMGWKQTLQRMLLNVEREEVDYTTQVPHFLTGSNTIPVHDSSLVRVFARSQDFLLYDGIDVFIAKYVRQREDAENLDFGRPQYRDLEEAIRREETHYTTDE